MLLASPKEVQKRLLLPPRSAGYVLREGAYEPFMLKEQFIGKHINLAIPISRLDSVFLTNFYLLADI